MFPQRESLQRQTQREGVEVDVMQPQIALQLFGNQRRGHALDQVGH
ncbi:MAG: hypothetical protein H6962_11720 [Chromatiaceae bacterium]|nr:hypothetical protein [Chromatiaceae bacterium]